MHVKWEREKEKKKHKPINPEHSNLNFKNFRNSNVQLTFVRQRYTPRCLSSRKTWPPTPAVKRKTRTPPTKPAQSHTHSNTHTQAYTHMRACTDRTERLTSLTVPGRCIKNSNDCCSTVFNNLVQVGDKLMQFSSVENYATSLCCHFRSKLVIVCSGIPITDFTLDVHLLFLTSLDGNSEMVRL